MRTHIIGGRGALAGAVVTLALTLGPAATPAMANGPTVTGSGSTWVQIALDQWRADIGKQGYTINYAGNGSGVGRSQFIGNTVDFAASEIPFITSGPNADPPVSRPFQYLPDVAGGTSIMYNLHSPDGHRITSLRLDAHTAGRIFTGQMKYWHDPEIAALNPGLAIAEDTITPVVRSDSSGTSAQFALYLQSQANDVWSAYQQTHQCPTPCQSWNNDPPFAQAQNGSDGVANFVASDDVGKGAAGYVEAGFAFARNFPVASLKNASGNFAQPLAENVALALTHATLHPDLTQDLSQVYVAPEPGVYPMSSYSYMITQTTGFDPAKGQVLGTWILYIACAGQREAKALGYSPIPRPLIQADFDAVRRIPGAPAPPALDYQHCPNPTIAPNAPPPGAGAHPDSGGVAKTAATSASGSGGPAAAANTTTGDAGSTAQHVAGIAVLDAATRSKLLRVALQQVAKIQPPDWWPLAAAAGALLFVVFAPSLISWRRAPRGEMLRGSEGPRR